MFVIRKGSQFKNVISYLKLYFFININFIQTILFYSEKKYILNIKNVIKKGYFPKLSIFLKHKKLLEAEVMISLKKY